MSHHSCQTLICESHKRNNVCFGCNITFPASDQTVTCASYTRVSVNTYVWLHHSWLCVIVVVVTMMRLPYVNYQAIRVALSLNHKRYRQNAPPTLCQSNIEANKLHSVTMWWIWEYSNLYHSILGLVYCLAHTIRHGIHLKFYVSLHVITTSLIYRLVKFIEWYDLVQNLRYPSTHGKIEKHFHMIVLLATKCEST